MPFNSTERTVRTVPKKRDYGLAFATAMWAVFEYMELLFRTSVTGLFLIWQIIFTRHVIITFIICQPWRLYPNLLVAVVQAFLLIYVTYPSVSMFLDELKSLITFH